MLLSASALAFSGHAAYAETAASSAPGGQAVANSDESASQTTQGIQDIDVTAQRREEAAQTS
jgi:hypothetical protein